MLEYIKSVDSEIFNAINQELERQQNKIELIASENFTSLAVMQAQGTWLTNKYAEGLPGKRYYGGCEYVDVVENIARERAKKLFKAEHANVQPHSGAQANMAVYFAFLKPGDKVLGMNLSHGGHLTHGSPVNISGSYYNFISYGVSAKTEMLDYDELEKLALAEKPKMIVGGASAYSRIIDFKRMSEIAKKVGAILFIDMAHIAGLVASGLHPNPVEYADIVTSTTHKTLRGPRGGLILCKKEYQKQIDKAVFPGIQGGPLMHVISAKAIAFAEAMDSSFKIYQSQVIKNAQALAKRLQEKGFRLVSGGTDNHLILIDLTSKQVTGKDAEIALDEVGITVNKNTIPFETLSPFITSGIRLGTPAMTTRGLIESDMIEIANLISDVIDNIKDKTGFNQISQKVKQICDKYPLYKELKK